MARARQEVGNLSPPWGVIVPSHEGGLIRTLPPPIDLLLLDLEERPWAWYASCREADADLFFEGSVEATAEARRICSGCPVRQECLEWALDTRVPYGIWGGLTERQRRRLLRRTA